MCTYVSSLAPLVWVRSGQRRGGMNPGDLRGGPCPYPCWASRHPTETKKKSNKWKSVHCRANATGNKENTKRFPELSEWHTPPKKRHTGNEKGYYQASGQAKPWNLFSAICPITQTWIIFLLGNEKEWFFYWSDEPARVILCTRWYPPPDPLHW